MWLCYKHLNNNDKVHSLIKLLNVFEETIRDIRRLHSVKRLSIRATVSWSCYVKTNPCPMPNCSDDETQQHLLMDCYCSQKIWRPGAPPCLSDGMGCISAYGMDRLHVLEGSMNAERYIKVLEKHYFRECLVCFSWTMQNHILQLL